MNERIAQHALARHFDYFSQYAVPNVYVGGGEMDLAVVTRSGYLVEVEVKVSLSDWNADRSKGKWSDEAAKHRGCISRFYYAVPTELIAKAPAWVPHTCGLLELQWSEIRKSCYVIERRAAQRNTQAKKLTDADLLLLLRSTYHRFWQRELRAA